MQPIVVVDAIYHRLRMRQFPHTQASGSEFYRRLRIMCFDPRQFPHTQASGSEFYRRLRIMCFDPRQFPHTQASGSELNT